MNIEIEKKYIIKMPDIDRLKAFEEYTASFITQIYLMSEKGVTHRVRSREMQKNTVFTETKKVRIDEMSSYEDEREVSEAEFSSLAKKIDQKTRPIEKMRYTFKYRGQLFEIDVYPEWKNSAILETELQSRECEVDFPSIIEIIRDVTGDRRYSNASMARDFPREDK